MKKTFPLIVILYLCCLNGYSQLLSKPSLTVEDFENALTNTTQLRKILKKHDFEYSASGSKKFSPPGSLINPLSPDLRTTLSEQWEIKDKEDNLVLKVDKFEWERDHAPHADVVKTIRLMVKQNSVYSEKFVEFLEVIREKYPIVKSRYYGEMDQYIPYREVMDVFTNDSDIEVRTGETGAFYTVSFDLIRAAVKD